MDVSENVHNKTFCEYIPKEEILDAEKPLSCAKFNFSSDDLVSSSIPLLSSDVESSNDSSTPLLQTKLEDEPKDETPLNEHEKLKKEYEEHQSKYPHVYTDAKSSSSNTDVRETKEYSAVYFGFFSMLNFMKNEITRDYTMDTDDKVMKEKQNRVYTFARIPLELEKFMFYGVYQCADAFLYIFTILPLRILLSIYRVIRYRKIEPAQMCDFLKVMILVLNSFAINYIDVSMMYHLIKGQAIIKLYIFFSMLEVADRLFSSFGQDILDTVFLVVSHGKVTRRRDFLSLLLHIFIALIYVFLHVILIMFQTTTLSVAFNSHNKALLTIMMSNNFVELKGSVFKKFEKNNLFQMSCADVRERFHFIILLSLVCLRNLPEFTWDANTNALDHLFVLMPDVGMVLIFEVMVDWVKHAFITKFNTIDSKVYKEYTTSICYDMASSKEKDASSDYMDIVSRRMGFVPLPLAILLIRVVSNSLWKLKVDPYYVVIAFPCMVVFKMIFSSILLWLAIRKIRIEQTASKLQKEKDEKILSEGRDIQKSMNNAFFQGVDKKPLITDIYSPFILHQHQLVNSNSNVSLQSVALNENYVNEISKAGDGLRHRKSTNTSTTPLSEIDRYTMCSNRIM